VSGWVNQQTDDGEDTFASSAEDYCDLPRELIVQQAHPHTPEWRLSCQGSLPGFVDQAPHGFVVIGTALSVTSASMRTRTLSATWVPNSNGRPSTVMSARM
jgi:hypothetical protein